MKVNKAKYASSNSLLRKAAVTVFSTAVPLLLAMPMHATSLVINGSFESNGGNGQLGYNTSATGWSVVAPSGSYIFLFGPGTADTSGASGQYGNLALWGPGTGSANGLPSTSPNGGYYLALDADFQTSALTQTISGLNVGDTYAVSFYWAASQQYTFNGPTVQKLTVSLGSESQTTPTIDLPSHDFSGWQSQTFDYTATSSSEVLSFLAGGSPAVPPFTLLDGVSMTDTTSPVPEPGTWALMISGLMGGVVVLKSRKRLNI
jgi:PEP-CTERM motif